MIVVMMATVDFSIARELVTARMFFEDIAQRYAVIEDYEASVVIAHRRWDLTEEDDEFETTRMDPQEIELSRMEGAMSFKRPDLLRIDFSMPAGQVLVSNGELLTIYVPSLDYIMEQRLGPAATPAQASLSPALVIQGLRFLRDNYSIAYTDEGPDPIPLKDGSGRQGIHLLLERQVPEERFRTIEIVVGEDRLIHSIVGEYRSGDRFAIEFHSVRIDQSIPGTRFEYEAPPDANVYRDVLFGEIN